MVQTIDKMMASMDVLQSEDIANAIVYLLAQPDEKQIAGHGRADEAVALIS